MALPQVGQVINGYTYLGGDPNDKNSWRESSIEETAAAHSRGVQIGKQQGAVAADTGKMLDAASNFQSTAKDVVNALHHVQTGTGAETALSVAKLPIITDNKKAGYLGAIQNYGAHGALAAAQDMKGALSDNDINFLKSMTYDIKKTPMENKNIALAQQWAAARTKGYINTRQAWEKVRGPAGADFDQWWNQYADQTYPRPVLNQSSDTYVSNHAFNRGRSNASQGAQMTNKPANPHIDALKSKYGLE